MNYFYFGWILLLVISIVIIILIAKQMESSSNKKNSITYYEEEFKKWSVDQILRCNNKEIIIFEDHESLKEDMQVILEKLLNLSPIEKGVKEKINIDKLAPSITKDLIHLRKIVLKDGISIFEKNHFYYDHIN